MSKGREEPDRPWSPRSAASPDPSGKSRATQKSRAAERYPPLPESRMEEEESELGALRPMPPQKSRHSRAPSKASSLAPSDSPSSAGQKYHRTAKVATKEPSVKSPRGMQPTLVTNGHDSMSVLSLGKLFLTC